MLDFETWFVSLHAHLFAVLHLLRSERFLLLLLLHHHNLLHLLERDHVTVLVEEFARLAIFVVQAELLLLHVLLLVGVHLLFHHHVAVCARGRYILTLAWIIELVEGTL